MRKRIDNLLRRWRRTPQLAWSYRVARSARLGYGPLRLWIEPTNACMLRCPHCPTGSAPEASRGFMDAELFSRIIDQAADWAIDVNMHHRGESLLHPHLPAMIRQAAHAGLRVRLHTNGMLLDEPLDRELADAGLWVISFSLDGASAEQYESARPGGVFDRVVGNIRRFSRHCRRFGGPRIVVESMAQPGEPVRVLKRRLATLFADAPPDGIVVKQPHNWAGTVECGLRIADCIPQSAIHNSQSFPCTFPWYAMAIFWDGQVTPCPQDYYGRLALGDAKVQPLADIWNGPAMQSLRRRHGRRDVTGLEPCRACDRIRRPTLFGVPADFLGRFVRETMLPGG